MTESPDIPWARSDDSHGMPPKLSGILSPATGFFLEFLSSRGVRGGTILMVGCKDGSDAAHLAHAGFVVHAMDVSSASFKHLARYGVHTHGASPTEFWLFDNQSFDFVIDTCCFSKEPDSSKREFYVGELRRVLRPGGHYVLSGASTEDGFNGFDVVAQDKEKTKIMKKI